MINTLLDNESKPRILLMFVLLVFGILAKWFWDLGWTFLQNPDAGLDFGSWTVLAVRLGLSLIAGGLTFVPTYNKIGQASSESWVPYVLAFQNGFFWESALDAVL